MFWTRHRRCKQSPLDMARVRINIAKYLVPILPEYARPDAGEAFQCVVAFPNHTGQYASSCQEDVVDDGAESIADEHRPDLPHLFPQLTGGTCYPSPRCFPLTPSWVRGVLNPELWSLSRALNRMAALALGLFILSCMLPVLAVTKNPNADLLLRCANCRRATVPMR